MTDKDRNEQRRLLKRLAYGEQNGMPLEYQRKLEARVEVLDKRLDGEEKCEN